MASKTSILLIVTVIIVITTYHQLIFKITPYLFNYILQKGQINIQQSSHLLDLQTLEELTMIPVIGQFFLEDKVRILVKKRQWNDVLNQCQKIDGMFFDQGQNLLPLRAIAQCATLKFNKCESTLQKIRKQSPHLTESIRGLYHIVDSSISQKQEKKMRKQSIQIQQM